MGRAKGLGGNLELRWKKCLNMTSEKSSRAK